MKLLYSKAFQWLVAVLAALVLGVIYAGFGAYSYLAPSLPTAEELRGRDQQIPLRVYTRNGALIAQIGEQLRVPVAYEDIPVPVRNAFLAAEDDRFFQHGGIDLKGILRALYVDISTGDFSQGGSTITQQVARTIALSADKNLKRKLQEVFLTFRMEHEFTKQQILGAYLNEIYFGQRSYGVAAAAQVYFGKSLGELTVAEMAMLAGLPQAPSRYNPVTNAEKARDRRGYVIGRMRTLGMIDAKAAEQAQKEPVYAREFKPLSDVEAPYVAEMARQVLIERFGEPAVNQGYRVYTTIDGRLQTAANRAVRIGLLEYDRRHGYRGPLKRIRDAASAAPQQLDQALEAFKPTGLLQPAIVVSVTPKTARIYLGHRNYAQIDWEGMSWAAAGGQTSAGGVLSAGDLIYVVVNGAVAHLAQVPQAQGALASVDPDDGAVVALVGGYDFNTSKYNRATQAQRQPGSGIKPFLYSAALDSGVTPATIFLDAPVMTSNEELAERKWRPENSGGGFSGPMRLREALVRSRNLVSVRVLQGLFRSPGVDPTISYVARFGFNRADLPRADSLILGTLSAHPIDVVAAYASLANGGYKIDWYFIDRIENERGEVVWRSAPKRVCEACERARLLTGAPQSAPLDANPSAAAPGTSAGEAGVAVAATASFSALPAVPPPPAARSQLCMRDTDDVGLVPKDRIAPRIIPAATAWLIDDILKDVVLRGTGTGALVLNRKDLAGKTGTTNEDRDTWFNGFNRHLVASVWVGYDQSTPLGDGEQGARTALPIWVSYMREALRGIPEQPRLRPPGLMSARISQATGLLLGASDPGGIEEYFLAQFPPAASTGGEQPPVTASGGDESIF